MSGFMGGGGHVIGSVEADNDASLIITGLDSAYDTFLIELADMMPSADAVHAWMRLGDAGGIDSGVADYGWGNNYQRVDSASPLQGNAQSYEDSSDSKMVISNGGHGVGSTAGEGFGASLKLHRPGDGSIAPIITGTYGFMTDLAIFTTGVLGGRRSSVIALDRIQFLFSSGSILSGRMTVTGVPHA